MPDVTHADHPKRTARIFDLAEARERRAARQPTSLHPGVAPVGYRSTSFGDAWYHQAAIDADRPLG